MAKKKQKPEKSLMARLSRTRSQDLSRRFNDIFTQSFLPKQRGFFGDETAWVPHIHVLEKEDKYVVKVELPGVHTTDISVSITEDMLVVAGQKEAESEVKKKGYSYSETSYGSFSRSIEIPSIVDADRITANFDKGVLEIDLPKTMELKPKKVSVTTKKKSKTLSKEEKMQAYCMKDKKKVDIKDPKAITMKNGRPAIQGECPICGNKVFRIGSVK